MLEAGWRSGSLNTAGHAAQLGRPLGAVPGPVTSAASAGCHRLIRDFGAVCVTSPDEMAELAPLDGADAGVLTPDGAERAPAIELAAEVAVPVPVPVPEPVHEPEPRVEVEVEVEPEAETVTAVVEAEPVPPAAPARTDDRTRLLDAVSDRSPRAAKDIAKRAGFSVAAAQALLGVLELEGVVAERERGWVRPKPKKERGLL